jgi:putative ABC transport system substrate-binding protein
MAPKTACFPKAGGLISYGPILVTQFQQRAGISTANGAKPADLPVQYPTKLQLVINLKIAETLNLTIPESFLVRPTR